MYNTWSVIFRGYISAFYSCISHKKIYNIKLKLKLKTLSTQAFFGLSTQLKLKSKIWLSTQLKLNSTENLPIIPTLGAPLNSVPPRGPFTGPRLKF